MKKKITIGDKVRISGYYGELFEVKGHFEQLDYESASLNYELWLILSNKLNDKIVEENSQNVLFVHGGESNINSFLDEYNDYIILEQLFLDGEYKAKAEEILKQYKEI
ncbi:hypothetical protein EHS13_18670 [Paenibacillus psychroresistens]|uniref:Uncharacterized protein n=1 Tax=Paenibacillus psychroresistens TaxID=1778678 RepID=A0A6B8RN00_9BACL|nr:hypothetical protein [Paenibacillus psychroresistens]QGQ96756.1 hypothetical protein EHS13_18670 [Paenibacillus psychroresistens]